MGEQTSEETGVEGSEETNEEGSDAGQNQQMTEKPEVTDEHREKAKEMAKAFEERPTAVLPGSGNTITGTAINDWLDDDGNPKYGQDKEDSPEGESTKDTAEEK